jgi:hypothetical protein
VCACADFLSFLPHFLIHSSSSRVLDESVGRNIFNYSHVACVVTGMMQVVWRVCGDVVLW